MFSFYNIFALLCSVAAFSPINLKKSTTLLPRKMSPSTSLHMSATKPKKVIVFGGDGFCGWPTSLYLSDQGHEVIIVDNLSRRKIDIELGCDSLTPIATAESRVNVWNAVSRKQPLKFKFLDLKLFCFKY